MIPRQFRPLMRDPSPIVQLSLPYPPSVNNYWRVFNGRSILSAEARDYKNRASAIARRSEIRPLSGPVYCAIDVFRPRQIGDLDNTLKALLDSLREVAFHDDSQVTGIFARRHDDKHSPRAEIQVTHASPNDLIIFYEEQIARLRVELRSEEGGLFS